MRGPYTLPALKRQILKLSPQQQRSLLNWLQFLMEESEETQEVSTPQNREVLATHLRGQITYQQELVCCGKEGCRCSQGQLHGPYWYAYYREGGKMHSAYVGKHLKR